MKLAVALLVIAAAAFVVYGQDNDPYAVPPLNLPCPEGFKLFTFQSTISVTSGGSGTAIIDAQFSFDPAAILGDGTFQSGFIWSDLSILNPESGQLGAGSNIVAKFDASGLTYLIQTPNRDIHIQIAATYTSIPTTTEGLNLTPTTLVEVIFIDGSTNPVTSGNSIVFPTILKIEKCPLASTSTSIATSTEITSASSTDTSTGTDNTCHGCACDCVSTGLCSGFDFSLFVEGFCPNIRFIPSFCFCGTPIPEPDDSSSSSSNSIPDPDSSSTGGVTNVDGQDPASSEDCDDDDFDHGHHKRHGGHGTKVKCRHRPSWWDWFSKHRPGGKKHREARTPSPAAYDPHFLHHGHGDKIDCPWFKLSFRGIKQCKPGFPCRRVSKMFSGPRWSSLVPDPTDPNSMIATFIGTVKFAKFDPNKIDLKITAKYTNGDGANNKDELELSWELGGNGGDVWPIGDDQLFFSLRISTNAQFSFDLPADKQTSGFKTFSLTSRKGTSKTGLELGFKLHTENNEPLVGIKHYPYKHGLDLSLIFDKDNFGPDGVLVYDPNTKMVYSDPGSASSLASWLSVFAAWFC